jgi:outer membrane protein assembly factor BamD
MTIPRVTSLSPKLPGSGSDRTASSLLRSLRTGSLLIACALPLAGCESLAALNPFDRTEKYKPEVVPEVPADVLYNDGLARLSKQDYDGATKKFGDIDKQYPYSPWAPRALLLTAFAHYEAGQYDDAMIAARRYVTLHPSTADTAYAQYLYAMSNYNQIPDVTRDQERTEKALQSLQELIDRYPSSEYVRDAREKIAFARDQLAGKEMDVGRFYLKKRNFTGAINRFKDVVSRYQTTRHVEEALMRLTEAYMAVGVVNEAQTAAAVLGHNFPDSPWYKDAYSLLQSGGLEPREDQGSWLSRTFRGFTRTVGLGG